MPLDFPPTNKEPQEYYYVIHNESRIQQLKGQDHYGTQKHGTLVGNNNSFLSQTHGDPPSSTVSNGTIAADNSVLSISGPSDSYRDDSDTVNVKKLQPENIKLIRKIIELNKKIQKSSFEEEILLITAQRDDIIEQYFEYIILQDPEQAEYYRITERQAKRNSATLEELTRSSTSQVSQNRHNSEEQPRATKGYQDNSGTTEKTTGEFTDRTLAHQDNAQRESATITEYQNDDQTSLIELQKQHNTVNSPIKGRAKRSIANVDQTINQDSNGHLGQHLEGSMISAVSSQGDRVVTGVAEGVRNNDVANIAQLNRVVSTATSAHSLAQTNASRINNIEKKLSKTNTKIDQGLAVSAALTGLFQPYGVGNVNITASIGGYGASLAIAVGTGYRIDENIAAKAGVAYSDGNSAMYNVSFNLEW